MFVKLYLVGISQLNNLVNNFFGIGHADCGRKGSLVERETAQSLG